MNLFYGILFGILAQTLSFAQLQGQFKIPLLKEHSWILVLMGIPVSFLFIQSVKHMVSYYNGEIWPSRLIGFSIGTIVFTVLSHFFFHEQISLKTGICLSLCVSVLLIQLFWK